MSRKLEGKVAIVTGAGRGIGRCIALKFANEGASVVVNDLDAAPANEVVAEIRAAGGQALAFPCNVTAPDFGDRLVKATLESFGGIDIIVNNAGYTWDNVIQKMSDEQWDAILDCHLKAPFNLLRAAQPYFREASKAEAADGREVFRKVVNISSTSGTQGNAGQVNYSAAKAGVMGMTKTLAREWGRMKVNVNCVAFGFIATRLTEPTAEEKTVSIEGRDIKVGVNPDRIVQASKEIALGRPGTPEEAAGSVFMFCIPESDYVTGQTIICGGGRGGF
ncbi:3-oxoacyl-[acyl-carrier protein] reductase [Cupriavidus sp. OV038]|jgi:3-oxoacyl-[acyl-carrier protein] reductase|uniref:SDR family NAD(P)-dependent oxidoreductase n=1 Tax=unclassified Cupriavidus TaxID=2640874 RepID=UPI0008DF124B|nr:MULTISPECIES: SDR family NAD(P)-dependent oxidoreductase [unclassified Cupriavidus]SFC99281.1 3-oxoacyl-[acyl-carrier protein] reductase [Cupriavidus sp. OV038]SFP62144.1 3-oxoacyl-[acyl-carrier protein] reductase [Cupriavidus sp. OV096]